SSQTHNGTTVRGCQELDVAREVLGLARVPDFVALAVGSCDAVAAGEGAVQDQVCPALLAAPLQGLVQVGGLVGQGVDGLVQVAVAGGLGNACVTDQAVHAAGLAEPAQCHDLLTERPQCP